MSGPVPRCTIARAVHIEGLGLFMGGPVSVEIEPASPETGGPGGIVFTTPEGDFAASVDRIDGRPAHPAFAQMPPRSTSLALMPSAEPIHTVEHLLSAFAGLGVTDAVVRVTGGELPIGGGSAWLFAEPMIDAGLVRMDGWVEPVVVTEPIVVEDGDTSVRLEPAGGVSFEYHLDYGPGSPVPGGVARWDGSAEAYTQGIARARTFCLQQEAEALHAAGLFTNLTPRDMLVFGAGGPIENELLFEDEPARHKLLDLIGDLALVGRPIVGRVVGVKSGHALNREAARRLAASVG